MSGTSYYTMCVTHLTRSLAPLRTWSVWIPVTSLTKERSTASTASKERETKLWDRLIWIGCNHAIADDSQKNSRNIRSRRSRIDWPMVHSKFHYRSMWAGDFLKEKIDVQAAITVWYRAGILSFMKDKIPARDHARIVYNYGSSQQITDDVSRHERLRCFRDLNCSNSSIQASFVFLTLSLDKFWMSLISEQPLASPLLLKVVYKQNYS